MNRILHGRIEQFSRHYRGPLFHALLCDAPYHLYSIVKRFGANGARPARGDVYARSSKGFMNQNWDGQDVSMNPETWAGLAEHLYPGAFLMVFAGTLNDDLISVAMREAGLVKFHKAALYWNYASGFPKATNISKQIDQLERRKYVQAAIDLGLSIPGNSLHDWTKAEHAPGDKWWEKFKAVLSDEQWQAIERQVIGKTEMSHQVGIPLPNTYTGERQYLDVTIPATPLAQTWAGHRYGLQALKPAAETILIFQKPYAGRPVDSITATGAGALNVDRARVATNDNTRRVNNVTIGGNGIYQGGDAAITGGNEFGRWPSNLLLGCSCNPQRPDRSQHEADCPVSRLGEMSGELRNGGQNETSGERTGMFGVRKPQIGVSQYPGDSGTAARFFFQADWSYEVAERLAQAEPVRYEAKASQAERTAGLDDDNPHPTVKPISLTKYLASLLLPPDAYAPRRILIPFAGVSSEMIGAILAGWEEVIGVEMTASYIPIARARLAWWADFVRWGQTDVDKILAAQSDTLPLFGEAA